MPGMLVHACNPSIRDSETGRNLEHNDQQAYLENSMPVINSVQKKIIDGT